MPTTRESAPRMGPTQTTGPPASPISIAAAISASSLLLSACGRGGSREGTSRLAATSPAEAARSSLRPPTGASGAETSVSKVPIEAILSETRD
jgi:hypothetical protein